MNRVFEGLKEYYERHNEIMQPELFAEKFQDVSGEEMLIGILEFDVYLDKKNAEVMS